MTQDIAKIVKSLHKMGIAHRYLTLDSVRMKRHGPSVKIILGGFDLAVKLAEGEYAVGKFGLDLAPEIEAGEPHDISADIWGLGMILKQLLSCVQDASA